MKEILTIRQVAELCAVAPSTVQYWERRGFLKSFKTLGGHRRFERGHVLEFLEKRGRSLTRESAKSILAARNRPERRSENRIPLTFNIQAQFVNGMPDNAVFQGRLMDVSSKGFGIVITSPETDQSLFKNLVPRCRNIKAWLKDQVGYLKSPLEGTIRNFNVAQDSIRIGLAFSR
jgi:excisionase family DNA binding protein